MTQRRLTTFKAIKIHLFTLLVVLSLLFTFLSCDKDNNCETEEETSTLYPALEIVNQLERKYLPITSVSLVGYEFNSLDIKWDESQTFTLDKGMPAGYKDINVSIMYGRLQQVSWINGKVVFTNGKTTIITLKGGSGAEGASQVYLEICQK